MIDRILSFRGKYAWLSNFHPCPVLFEDHIYPSVEHAYVAAKTLNPVIRDMVKTIVDPSIAKRYGRAFILRGEQREGWDGMRVDIMRELLRYKFSAEHNPDLRKKLDQTGSSILVEGNSWGDTFWGVYKGEGKNMLGRLLMEIRSDNRPSLDPQQAF